MSKRRNDWVSAVGRQADAEWRVAEVLAIKPDFKLDEIERIHPFQADAETETRKALLRQAGLCVAARAGADGARIARGQKRLMR
jgi:hypothetical protein